MEGKLEEWSCETSLQRDGEKCAKTKRTHVLPDSRAVIVRSPCEWRVVAMSWHSRDILADGPTYRMDGKLADSSKCRFSGEERCDAYQEARLGPS